MFTPGSRTCAYKTASGLGKWPNRDPILEAAFQYGFYTKNPNFLDDAEDGNEYLFVQNNPLNKYDFLGLCDNPVKSGPPQYSQGWWKTWLHHPFPGVRLPFPPEKASFTLTCPSSAPYLQTWGLTTSSPNPPNSPDHPFPSDFQTAPGSPTGSSGTYTIVIIWPSWPITTYPVFGDPNSPFVYVQGCCSCSKSTPTRQDPPPPPQHRPPGSGN